MDQPFTVWPSEPRDLIRIVVNPTSPPAARHRALLDLAPFIRRLALPVAAGFRGQIAADLVDEAVSWVSTCLTNFDPLHPGRLEGWITQVLYHRGVELRRRSRQRNPLNWSHTGSLAEENALPLALRSHPDPATATAHADPERLTQLQAALRRQLDILSGQEFPRGIHYYAVLLLQARLRLAACVQQSYAERITPPGEVAAMAQHLLPWRAQEQQLRIRADAPPLQQLWQGLGDLFDQTEAVGSLRIVHRLLEHFQGTPPLTVATWNQWVHRARRLAQQQLDPQVWHQLFIHWL